MTLEFKIDKDCSIVLTEEQEAVRMHIKDSISKTYIDLTKKDLEQLISNLIFIKEHFYE